MRACVSVCPCVRACVCQLTERPQCRQLDPARDASAKRRWAKLLRWCDITDLRLRNAHDRVSPEFRHGPHAGLPVADLVDSFMSGEERPEGLSNGCCSLARELVSREFRPSLNFSRII